MSTVRFGSVATKKGDNWAFLDGSGSYIQQSILRIPSGGYYIFVSYTNVLYKISDTGSIVWQKTVALGLNSYIEKIFSNGDILFWGFLSGSPNKGVIGRFNPETGSFSWYKQFVMGRQIEGNYLTMDSTGTYGYLYFHRRINLTDPNTDPIYPTLSRINLSNGSIQWTQEIVPPGGLRGYSEKAVVDTSGNVYVGGWYLIQSDFSEYRGFIIKYNSSGTAQWQKVFTRTNIGSFTSIVSIETLALDSSDNLHVGAIYRYSKNPTYGNAFYYAKLDSSGNLLNQYSVLPDPVPSIEFPTNIQSVANFDVDSSNNAYAYLYGRFNNSISTQFAGTLLKISSGNTLSYLSTVFFGSSVTSGFSGTNGFALDNTNNKMTFGIYVFTGGPETITFNVPNNGSASGISLAPKSLRVNYKNVMPATLGTPPITMSAGSLTLRSVTESYTFEDPATPAVNSVTYEKYVQRF